MITARQDDGVRPRQALHRLSQEAAWKQRLYGRGRILHGSQAPRMRAIDQDDVEVTGETPVLKAII